MSETAGSDPYGEAYCSIGPRMIWDAIEAAWEDGLSSWDLEGGSNHVEAKRLALDAIAKLIEENPG